MRANAELESLLEKLPPHCPEPLRKRKDLPELLEIILDLGRQPEARFRNESIPLNRHEVTEKDIAHVTERIGQFGEDNRAGIERTLHRISAIRNRNGKIIGLTLRVGRSIHGTIKVIEDLIASGKSVLLLGKPGVGKTTMLREVARVLADEAKKRVVVVDTSNEIAGDGDIPHPGIGRSRRMQVSKPELQHAVMIEAVENHMPEVIIVDEIGNQEDAAAARTIAERGVQLVATAHGNTLDNLIMNPTLSDLIGGVQSVTLGDDEARRRRTQKTVLERRAPPTFDVLVEIQNWNDVNVHPDVAAVVDRVLRGFPVTPEKRILDPEGKMQRVQTSPAGAYSSEFLKEPDRFVEPDFDTFLEEAAPAHPVSHILPLGVNRGKLRQVLKSARSRIELANDIEQADCILTTKNFQKRKSKDVRLAEEEGKLVFVLRKNTIPQMQHFLRFLARGDGVSPGSGESAALEEAEEGAARVLGGETQVHLHPQPPDLRRLQHQLAEKNGIHSHSHGREPVRHVVFHR